MLQYLETTVTIHSGDPTLALELIASLFYDLGLKGILVGGPDPATPDGWPTNDGGRDKESEAPLSSVTGYFTKNDQAQRLLLQLDRQLQLLEKSDRIITSVRCRPVAEEDWSESWKVFFEPVRVSRRLVVKPSWKSYVARKNEIVLELDPGMAFGTGSHPSTFMCLQMMETYLKPEDDFLDVGTGSGILMMAAARLGAKTVTGIDNDPIAVDVARKNLMKNGITKNCRLVSGSLLDPIRGRYDLVAANILAEVIIELLDDVGRVIRPGGFLVASGIIDERRQAVVDKMVSAGFTILKTATRDEWVCVVGQWPRRSS